MNMETGFIFIGALALCAVVMTAVYCWSDAVEEKTRAYRRVAEGRRLRQFKG